MSVCIHKRCFMGCINKLFSKSFEYLFGKIVSLARNISRKNYISSRINFTRDTRLPEFQPDSLIICISLYLRL